MFVLSVLFKSIQFMSKKKLFFTWKRMSFIGILRYIPDTSMLSSVRSVIASSQSVLCFTWLGHWRYWTAVTFVNSTRSYKHVNLYVYRPKERFQIYIGLRDCFNNTVNNTGFVKIDKVVIIARNEGFSHPISTKISIDVNFEALMNKIEEISSNQNINLNGTVFDLNVYKIPTGTTKDSSLNRG